MRSIWIALALCLSSLAAQAATISSDGRLPAVAPTLESQEEPILSGPIYLYNSGTPRTDPANMSGACTYPCFPWSSTFYSSPTNYDLTARRITVPIGSVATDVRGWWAYGNVFSPAACVVLGGSPADFSSYAIDLYADTGFGPGALVASLSGSFNTLNAATHYRELHLDTPYVFAAGSYYASLRATTAVPDFGAVLLWMACAPHDSDLDYEMINVGCRSGFGWTAYNAIPSSPCPADFDFGLQVMGYPAPDQVQMEADNDCISSIHPCANVSFDFVRGDTTPVRLVSTTFQLSANLELCGSLGASIHDVNGSPGAWLGAGFTPTFQAYGQGGGIYTVDVAVLGLPCGPINSGTLFTVDVKKATGAPDGFGTITITQVVVRDCLNAPLPGSAGAPANLTLDAVGPTAVANLTAPQKKIGNDGDGTTKIQVNFTAPVDAAVTEVYRAPFGNYPEYDDPPTPGLAPAAPSYPPGAPWTLTAVNAPGQYDEPAARDFWYYVVFTKDACGNVSSASNRTSGTLNYHLGDTATGFGTCTGDNAVGLADISFLGANYGGTLTPSNACLDVGPTTDFSVNARPTTDNLINFEDLILFAINYGGVVSLNGEGSEVAAVPESPRLRLSFDPARVDGARVARLWLDGNLEAVKGVHAGLRFDPRQAELLSVNPGDLVAAQSTETFFRAPTADGMLWVDLAALGNGRTLHGSGDLAIVTYRTRLATGPFTLATSDLRDRENRFLLDRPAGAPRHDVSNRHDLADPSPSVSDREELRWLGARPNPFPRSTELRFALGSAGPVEITIYNPAGRRVRGLLHEAMEAGEHVITWDGNDDQGRATGAAVYLVRVQAGDATTTAKLYRYR